MGDTSLPGALAGFRFVLDADLPLWNEALNEHLIHPDTPQLCPTCGAENLTFYWHHYAPTAQLEIYCHHCHHYWGPIRSLPPSWVKQVWLRERPVPPYTFVGRQKSQLPIIGRDAPQFPAGRVSFWERLRSRFLTSKKDR